MEYETVSGINWAEYERRVVEYENMGICRSDAQGIVDAEMRAEK